MRTDCALRGPSEPRWSEPPGPWPVTHAQALAAEVVALEEKSLAVRVRELRLDKELGRARESLRHMQRQLEVLTRDRGDLALRLSALQVIPAKGRAEGFDGAPLARQHHEDLPTSPATWSSVLCHTAASCDLTGVRCELRETTQTGTHPDSNHSRFAQFPGRARCMTWPGEPMQYLSGAATQNLCGATCRRSARSCCGASGAPSPSTARLRHGTPPCLRPSPASRTTVRADMASSSCQMVCTLRRRPRSHQPCSSQVQPSQPLLLGCSWCWHNIAVTQCSATCPNVVTSCTYDNTRCLTSPSKLRPADLA